MTSLSSRKRQRKAAKRKPSKSVVKPKRGIRKEKLQWRDVMLEISYERGAIGDLVSHLQVQVLSPKGVAIPVTDTGYRSHFISSVYVEGAGGPVAYVREWLDSEAETSAWKKKEKAARQLNLF